MLNQEWYVAEANNYVETIAPKPTGGITNPRSNSILIIMNEALGHDSPQLELNIAYLFLSLL